MLHTKKNKSAIQILLFTVCYFVAGLTGIFNHEVWLDEAHHFLIAKESTSLPDLFERIKYEGHPQLWSILLFIVTRFTDNIFYMQLLNCLIMTMVCFLFLKHSRFNMILDVAIMCGYFFIYEYLVISRSYSLFTLALTLVFIHLKEEDKLWKLYFSLLFLSFTHLFGIIITLVICILFLLKQLTTNNLKRYPFLIIIGISALILWWIKVPDDHFLFRYNTDGLLSYRRIRKIAGMFAKGLLPLPDMMEPVRWNSNFFTNQLRLAGIVMSVCIFGSILYFLRSNRKLLLLYFLACSAVCLTMYCSPVIISVRYCGILFILFIYITGFLLTNVTNKNFVRLTISLIAVQFAAGIIMLTTDLRADFSNSKNVAAYLKENKLAEKRLIISNFSSAPAIAYYLNRNIYYPETHEQGTYCKWNTWPFLLGNAQLTDEISRQTPANDTLVLLLNTDYFHRNLRDTLVFANSQLRYKLAKIFDGAMVNNENYFLFYVFSKPL